MVEEIFKSYSAGIDIRRQNLTSVFFAQSGFTGREICSIYEKDCIPIEIIC